MGGANRCCRFARLIGYDGGMRFRPRFTLKLLMLFVAAIGIFCAYQVNWIRQRHEALEELNRANVVFDTEVSAPWSIRLFFERGVPSIAVDPDIATDTQKVSRLKRLFPEATICTPADGLPVNRNPNPSFALIPI